MKIIRASTLRRETSSTYAIAGGTTPQVLYIYGTTDGTNYERIALTTTAGTNTITTQKGGTGTIRALQLGTEGSAALVFSTNSTARWNVSATGNLIASATNTYDFGASGATSPRAIYATAIINALNATAIAAGGAQAFGATSTATFGVYVGSGAPTVSAAKGSLYLRSDGSSTTTRAYIATDAAGTWTAITTAA